MVAAPKYVKDVMPEKEMAVFRNSVGIKMK